MSKHSTRAIQALATIALAGALLVPALPVQANNPTPPPHGHTGTFPLLRVPARVAQFPLLRVPVTAAAYAKLLGP